MVAASFFAIRTISAMRGRSLQLFYSACREFSFKGPQLLNVPVATTFLSKQYSQWDLVSAVCLERKPVITQDMTPIEKKYFNLVQQLELENSYLSDHEMKHLEDLKHAAKVKKGELEDLDIVTRQRAQEFEDACTEELQRFIPAPRVTEADKRNDKRSLERKLDRSLLLVVKQKLGNDYRWILPQGIHQEGETLRQTAERVLRSTCGDIKVRFMGNAPAGYYKYKYPKAARGNGIYGAKVFFFKAQYQSGDVCPEIMVENPAVEDYLWLTRPELKEALQPVYCKAIEAFLLDDEVSAEYDDADQDVRDKQTAVH